MIIYTYFVDAFYTLLSQLKRCPSAAELIPDAGEGLNFNHKTVPAKHRLLVTLHYLATQDSLCSIATQ